MMAFCLNFVCNACRYVPPPDEEVAPVTQLGLLEDMERFAARLVHLAPNSDIGHVRTLPHSTNLFYLIICPSIPTIATEYQGFVLCEPQ